jgi:O-antigen polymerase
VAKVSSDGGILHRSQASIIRASQAKRDATARDIEDLLIPAVAAHRPVPVKFTVRKAVFVTVGLYIALFQWVYVEYLFPTFGYLGFGFNAPSPGYLLLGWALALSPCLWIPLRLTRPSQLAYWVLYISVFVPSMFVPLYAEMEPDREIATMMLVFFMGFLVMGLSYRLPLWRTRALHLPARALWRVLGAVFALLVVLLMAVFGDHLHFVSFNDVYDLRDAANDITNPFADFAYMLLTGAVSPFFMGYGLFYRRRGLFLAGAAGQLLVYCVGGTKGSILSIVFISGMYLLLRVRRISFALVFSLSCLALLALFAGAYLAAGKEPGVALSVALFVVFSRTLGMGGLLTAQYYDFFQSNPFTYWSHLKIVNWFVHYPYQYPVGQELGLAYVGTTRLDATTHFFATDGIEAAGLPGLFLIALFCAFVFWVLDSAAQKHDPRLAALVTTYAAYNLANISIFTALLSGGLGLLTLLLYLLAPGPSRPDEVEGIGRGVRGQRAARSLPDRRLSPGISHGPVRSLGRTRRA